MGLLHMQNLLETKLSNASAYSSDADSISQRDDSQYWSITDYPDAISQ